MSTLNLNRVKRKLEEEIQGNQQGEALKTVLEKKLREEFNCKDLKAAIKEVNECMAEKEKVEDNYQTRLDKLEEKINEYGILKG